MPERFREETIWEVTAMSRAGGWALTVGGVAVGDDRDGDGVPYGGLDDHALQDGMGGEGSLLALPASSTGFSFRSVGVRFDDRKRRTAMAIDVGRARFRDMSRRDASGGMVRKRGTETPAACVSAITLGTRTELRPRLFDAVDFAFHGGLRLAWLQASAPWKSDGGEDRIERRTVFTFPLGVTVAPRRPLFEGMGVRIRADADLAVVPAGGDLTGSDFVRFTGGGVGYGAAAMKGARDMDGLSLQGAAGLRIEAGELSAGLDCVFRTGTKTTEHGGMLEMRYEF
jgi:hypothetical protein